VGASTKCVIIGPFPYQVFFELLKLCFGPSWHVFFEVHDALYNSNCIMEILGVKNVCQTLNTKFSLSGPEPLHTYMSCSGLSPSVLQPAPHISLRNWPLQAQHDRYVTYESYLLHCQGPHLLQNQFIQRTVCQNQSSKSRKSIFLSQQAN